MTTTRKKPADRRPDDEDPVDGARDETSAMACHKNQKSITEKTRGRDDCDELADEEDDDEFDDDSDEEDEDLDDDGEDDEYEDDDLEEDDEFDEEDEDGVDDPAKEGDIDDEEEQDETDDAAATREADTSSAAEEDEAATGVDNAVSLTFTGSTSEYFRVWIVNVCLTILTLGVFSAWAKVRRQRYLFASTRLDGSPFEYLGRPIPILKGRLIAAVLAGSWYASRQFMPQATPYVLLVAVLLSPWVIAKSMAFRANATAFRNIRLAFKGSVRSAVTLIYGWLLTTAILIGVVYSIMGKRLGLALGLGSAAALVAGVGYLFLEQKVRRYLVTNTSFGGIAGKFGVTVKHLFLLYLKALLVVLVASMPLSILLTMATSFKGVTAIALVVAVPYITLGVFYTYKQARIFKLCWNRTRFGGLYFRSDVGFRELLKLYAFNVLGIVVSLGLLIPWATIRTVRYRVEHTHPYIDGGFEQFEATASPGVNAIGAEIAETFDMDLAF